jgi:CRISPR-associated protein Csd2
VRAFGHVFPFKGSDNKGKKAKGAGSAEEGKSEDQGVSVGVRGPVSIQSAFSVAPVNGRTTSLQITKSVNLENVAGDKKGSDTVGMKHRVNHGVYVFYGSMNPQLASKTLFSDNDAKVIKEALRTLFVNDASSARPEGSMEVHKVFWWEQKLGEKQLSSAKVHRSLVVNVKEGVAEPKTIEDYEIKTNTLDGLSPEEINGE